MYAHLNTNNYCGKIKKFINDPFKFNHINTFLVKQSFLEKNFFRFFRKKEKNEFLRNKLIYQLQFNKDFVMDNLDEMKNELLNLDIKSYRKTLEGKNTLLLENYYIDYLVDYFQIDENGNSKNYEKLKPYISYVQLSELLFHILNNDIDIKFKDNTYFIYPNNVLKNQLKRRWLAMEYENGSHIALISQIVLISHIFKTKKLTDQMKLEAISNISNAMMDRIFLINFNYLKIIKKLIVNILNL